MDINTKKFFGGLFFFIFLLNFASSFSDITISVDEVFYQGDEVKFAYRFISDINETITFIPRIFCSNNLEQLLNPIEIEIFAGEPYYGEYSFGVVDEYFESGECNASVYIIEPYTFNKRESFRIEALSSFDFALNLDKTVFIQGESIYMDYSSDVEIPLIKTNLIYPDENEEEINLPFEMKLTQIGAYTVEAIASKEGYKDVFLSKQFAVIKEDDEIEHTGLEIVSVKGDGEEKLGFLSRNLSWILLGVLGIICAVILVVVFLIVKAIKRR